MLMAGGRLVMGPATASRAAGRLGRNGMVCTACAREMALAVEMRVSANDFNRELCYHTAGL